MPNTFAAIVPVAFQEAKIVARELAPAVQAVSRNFTSTAAFGDTIKIPVADVAASGAYTPAMSTTAGTDSVDDSINFTLSVNDKTDWHLTDEQARSLDNAGMLAEWQRQKIAQGLRKLVNNMEALVLTTAKQGASRAVGTAGTTPFATDLSILTAARRVLTDNGAPDDGRRFFICDTAASSNALNLAVLQQVQNSGGDDVMTYGRIAKRIGFDVRESAQVALHTKGTGASYVTSGSTAPGTTSIALVTGTGTVLAGDVVTFAADANNKYVINQGVAAPGTIKIGRPGARVTIATANAMTIGNNFTANVAFHSSGILLAARPPIIDPNANMRTQVIGDPETGLSFLFVEITGDGMKTWRLHSCYGCASTNPEFVVTAMG
jgi:hypothetical protein